MSYPAPAPTSRTQKDPGVAAHYAGPINPWKDTMDTTTWLLADEAAEYMRMHRDTVYKLLQRGELRGVKVGKHWRTRSDWCNDYLMGAHA